MKINNIEEFKQTEKAMLEQLIEQLKREGFFEQGNSIDESEGTFKLPQAYNPYNPRRILFHHEVIEKLSKSMNGDISFGDFSDRLLVNKETHLSDLNQKSRPDGFPQLNIKSPSIPPPKKKRNSKPIQHIPMHTPFKPDTRYTWNPINSDNIQILRATTTYGVIPLPAKDEQVNQSSSDNRDETNPYQRLIAQPDAASHAPFIHLLVPQEENIKKSPYEYANEFGEASENVTNMGESAAKIFKNEELAHQFEKVGDYITFGKNFYLLTHANNIEEQNIAFENTLEDAGKWWAKREIPYVGEALLIYDVGSMFYNGIRYDLIPKSQRMAYYDAEDRYEIEYANNPLSNVTQYWHNRVEELKKYAGYSVPVQAKFEKHDPNRYTDNPNGR